MVPIPAAVLIFLLAAAGAVIIATIAGRGAGRGGRAFVLEHFEQIRNVLRLVRFKADGENPSVLFTEVDDFLGTFHGLDPCNDRPFMRS